MMEQELSNEIKFLGFLGSCRLPLGFGLRHSRPFCLRDSDFLGTSLFNLCRDAECIQWRVEFRAMCEPDSCLSLDTVSRGCRQAGRTVFGRHIHLFHFKMYSRETAATLRITP